jgi:hypothetical protein
MGNLALFSGTSMLRLRNLTSKMQPDEVHTLPAKLRRATEPHTKQRR